MMTNQESSDYQRVERAINYLVEGVERQPRLSDVAEAVGLSAHRTQKLFKRWAGVSPKRFLEFLTVEHAKELLDSSASVLDASYAVGLSGPGRLHDHFVKLEAMSPGEYKSGGEGLRFSYGRHASPFGEAFLVASGRGVVRLTFPAAEGFEDELADFRSRWPRAEVARDERGTAKLARQIFGEREPDAGEILVRVQGTNFQLAVWKALMGIPSGRLVPYGAIAKAVGKPAATRAVGSAVGANPVAFLIPCHRVIRQGGVIGNYRWGSERKRAMIAWESAQL